MSSILTNNSAMVALQTLKSINGDLSKTQSMISTGKDVASAKDNASIWAISKVMEADVKGFKGISDSLSRGESTVAVARQASETITDLLTDVKGKIVAAQEGNADERAKIQTDINALTDQIKSVVGAAQFNGVNLLSGGDDYSILSSLDRSADGTVKSGSIDVTSQDLSFTDAEFGSEAALTAPTISAANLDNSSIDLTNIAVGGTFDGTGEGIIAINGEQINFAEGNSAAATQTNIINAINAAEIEGISATTGTGTAFTVQSEVAFGTTTVEMLQGTSGVTAVAEQDILERAETATFAATDVNEGDSYRISLGANNFEYVAADGDGMEEIVNGLKAAIDANGNSDIQTQVRQDDNGLWQLAVDNSDATTVGFTSTGNAEGGTAAGGLKALEEISILSDETSTAALTAVEDLISTAINAAAQFGSAQGRIETQGDFISKLTDGLKSGIGSLVDADMEEASARLQALQVQQQLGVQSLSIANQAPQSILSLFR